MKRLYLAISLLTCANIVQSSPWIGTSDKQLHQDLQILAEWGYLDAAVTSYPVPWKGIIPQLHALSGERLPSMPHLSLQRLLHYARQYQEQNSLRSARGYLANDDSRFSSFNGEQGNKAQLQISNEGYWGRWAGKLAINSLPGGKRNLDQSYLAYQFGDWNLRLGAIDQWWGPAQSASLILSDNARPLPALALSRSQSSASSHPWLKWLGPWYFTAQMGVMEKQRHVPRTRQWLSRFTFRPLKGLEIGASWSAMWGGQGQGNTLGDFWDVLTAASLCPEAQPNCDDELKSKKGNQLAGFDLTYSFQLFNQPISLYAQQIGEDASSQFKPTDSATLLGIASYVGQSKVYLEHSDTNVSCGGDGSTATNCYYEHGTYQSGYRRYGRAIGSTFDSDAEMLTLGSLTHFSNGDVLQLNLRKLTLNPDGTRPSPVINGKTETSYQISGFYRTAIDAWQLKLGARIERNEVDQQNPDWDTLLYTEIQYAWPE